MARMPSGRVHEEAAAMLEGNAGIKVQSLWAGGTVLGELELTPTGFPEPVLCTFPSSTFRDLLGVS